MVSCRSLSWILWFWSLIFTYTLLTHEKISNKIRTVPLILLFLSISMCAGILIYEKVVKYTKTIIWLAFWSLLTCIGLILYTMNWIDDVFINIYITVFSAFASVFWCVASHSERVTEPGLHWYIWSITIIITICCAFHNSSDTAITVYIVNCIIISLINIGYLYNICKVQPSGNRRCKRWWRVIACFTLSVILLIGSILHKIEEITVNEWERYILFVEGIILLFVLVDFVIGFYQERIYEQLPQQEQDVL